MYIIICVYTVKSIHNSIGIGLPIITRVLNDYVDSH